MEKVIYKSAAGIVLASIVGLGACTDEGVDEGGIDLPSGVTDEASAAPSQAVIARVDGVAGTYVEWLAPRNPGEEPGIAIHISYPNRSLLDPSFMEDHSALEAFLAVAPVDAEVPAALLEHSSASRAEGVEGDAHGVERRLALRRVNEELLDARAALGAEAPVDQLTQPGSNLTSDCDAGFKSWAQGEYGRGYGNSSTCSTNTGFSEHTFATYYCDPGPGNDCSYPIGGLAGCYPAGDPSCSAFRGDLLVHRARSVIGNSATFSYNMTGHRYRFGTANCSYSGNVTMERKRGTGSWINTAVGPRSMLIYVDGAAYPVATANPTVGVAYGLWKQLIPQSGATYLMNELDVTTGAAQEAIVCADVYRKFETFDITPYGCNFNEEFCEPNTSCDGACWD